LRETEGNVGRWVIGAEVLVGRAAAIQLGSTALLMQISAGFNTETDLGKAPVCLIIEFKWKAKFTNKFKPLRL
jgi:hypothetical protein